MVPVLGYWNVRGYAQPIRLMLVYSNMPFEDKQYKLGPGLDRSEWLKVKEKNEFGLDFPNLPYYIDGKVKLTQSIAITRYLARKLKLEPETEEDMVRAYMIEQQLVDIRTNLGRIYYTENFEKSKEEYLKTVPTVLKSLSDYLGKRNWFASQDKLTYVDFLAYETLDRHRVLDPHCLNDFQNLKDFTERVEDLPGIRKYLQSESFLNLFR